MKRSYSLTISILIIILTISCASPFNVTINIGAPGTNTPSQPTAAPTVTSAPSITSAPAATPLLNLTKTVEAAAILTQFSATNTAEVQNKDTAIEECMQDVPVRGDSDYNTLICEDFLDNTNQWRTGTDSDEKFGSTTMNITDSQYVWDVSSKHGVFDWECMNTPDLENFEASMEVQKLRGPTSAACYALVFRVAKTSTDVWNYYSYFVCDDNNFYVARQSNTVWSPVIYKKSAGAVKPGSSNWLTVVGNGSHFEFYVNDHKAGVAQDDRLKSGGVCLGMEVPANLNAGFAFEKFVVRAP